MKKNLKKLSAFLLATMMVVATGCSSSTPSSSTAASTGDTPASAAPTTEVADGASISQDNDIVAAINVDFTTMDPLDTSDTLSGGIQRLMMDGLFGFDEDMAVIPLLATGYEGNEDATEYTISIREGVTFSDGTPLNAEAVKANFDRWADKTLGLKRTTLLSGVLQSTEVVDEYTVKVTLSSPFGAFINTLAHPACLIVSPEQIANGGNDVISQNPIGTGQYTFVEWIPGESATIALNLDWWGYDAEISGGTALVDADAGYKTVTFRPVSESATRVAMVQSGDADIIWPIPDESVALLQADSNVQVQVDDGLVVRYLMMNNMKAPFDDVNVRQAINHAIDKDAYVAVVKNGLGSPAESVIAPQVQFFKSNEPYAYDIEKAKSLLAEAGYPDGFTTSILCSSTTANLKQAEFLQQQLAQVGITVEIKALESAVVNEIVQDSYTSGAEAEVEMYIIGWSPSTGDADWGIRPLLAEESLPPNSYNISYYVNPEFDAKVFEALETADPAVRAAAYAEAQDIVWADSPLVALSTDATTIATGKNIVDVSLFPDNCINLRNGKMA